MVSVTPVVTYVNGDVSQYLDVAFRMRWLSGEPHPADGENTDVRWFHRDELPSLSPDMAERVEAALANQPEARFRGGEAPRSR
jgi:NADH pyrophosphatase NudC (nudix superfamily)